MRNAVLHFGDDRGSVAPAEQELELIVVAGESLAPTKLRRVSCQPFPEGGQELLRVFDCELALGGGMAKRGERPLPGSVRFGRGCLGLAAGGDMSAEVLCAGGLYRAARPRGAFLSIARDRLLEIGAGFEAAFPKRESEFVSYPLELAPKLLVPDLPPVEHHRGLGGRFELPRKVGETHRVGRERDRLRPLPRVLPPRDDRHPKLLLDAVPRLRFAEFRERALVRGRVAENHERERRQEADDPDGKPRHRVAEGDHRSSGNERGERRGDSDLATLRRPGAVDLSSRRLYALDEGGIDGGLGLREIPSEIAEFVGRRAAGVRGRLRRRLLAFVPCEYLFGGA